MPYRTAGTALRSASSARPALHASAVPPGSGPHPCKGHRQLPPAAMSAHRKLCLPTNSGGNDNAYLTHFGVAPVKKKSDFFTLLTSHMKNRVPNSHARLQCSARADATPPPETSEDIFGFVTTGETRLASTGLRPGMVLNILKCGSYA